MPKGVCPFCNSLIQIHIRSTSTFEVRDIQPVDLKVPVYGANGEPEYYLRLVYINGICRKCNNPLRIPIFHDMTQKRYIIKDSIEKGNEEPKYTPQQSLTK